MTLHRALVGRLLFTCSTLVVVTAPARGQSPSVPTTEFGFGYSVASRDYGVFPLGWIGSITVPMASSFALVGETNASYKTAVTPLEYDPAIVTRIRAYSFLGGPRFSSTLFRRHVFGEVLLGDAHTTSINTLTGRHSADFLAWQPAVGADVYASRNVSLRVKGSYQFTASHDTSPRTVALTTELIIKK